MTAADLARVDVPLATLERETAAARFQERLDRAAWLLRHPEWPTGTATAGELAEYRHTLYDADPDATAPPLVDLHHHQTTRRRAS